MEGSLNRKITSACGQLLLCEQGKNTAMNTAAKYRKKLSIPVLIEAATAIT
jgi:hypothetical protein